MRMNLWKVTFTSQFSSSSGMKPYSLDPVTRTEHVLTEIQQRHLDDVESVIRESFCGQTVLTGVSECAWIGTATVSRKVDVLGSDPLTR